MRKLLVALRDLMIYISLVGGVPMLVIVTSGFVGFLLGVYVVGSEGLMTFILAWITVAPALTIGIRLQEVFLKKFPQYATD